MSTWIHVGLMLISCFASPVFGNRKDSALNSGSVSQLLTVLPLGSDDLGRCGRQKGVAAHVPVFPPRPGWTVSTAGSPWSTCGSGCSTSPSTATSSSVHTVATWTTILWSHFPPLKFWKLIDESFALVIALLSTLLLYYISFLGKHSVMLISFLT